MNTLFSFSLLVLSFITAGIMLGPNLTKPAHKLNVGECAFFETTLEAWEKPKMRAYKILEIGKEAYKVDFYSGAKWTSEIGYYKTLSFFKAKGLVKVECPK